MGPDHSSSRVLYMAQTNSKTAILNGIIFYFSSQAPFKQYSEIPQVTPHWLLGNESFGGELFIDTTLNHYKALGDNR